MAPSGRALAVEADHERRDVVALHGANGELANAGEDGVEDLARAFLPVRLDAGEQTVLAVLLARRAQRLGDAVAERDEEVTGMDRDRVLFEARVLEEPED